MKMALKTSLLANFLLGVVVCYQAARTGAKRFAPDSVVTNVHPMAQPVAAVPQPPPAPALGFDWRERVESADYPTYMANLRAIHCPEPTVRDIIRADVASLFAQKRQELFNSVTVARWSPAEEARLIAVLFGDPFPQTAASQPVAVSEEAVAPVKLPLILQTQALATLKLSDEQRQELGQLEQQFVQEIGGMNQDPNDPGYQARWQTAQPKFDELIVRAIGRRALVDLDEAIPPPDTNNQ